MRSLVAVLLATLMLPPPAAGESSGFAEWARTYGSDRNGARSDRFSARAAKINAESGLILDAVKVNGVYTIPNVKAPPPEALAAFGHQGQALLTMMILATVDIVRQEIELAHLKREDVNYEEVLKLSARASNQIVQGGSTWFGVGGGALATVASKPVMSLFNAIIDDQVSRKWLRTFLKGAAASTVMYVGWDIGGEVWTQARELITDDADYARAVLLGPMMYGALKQVLNGQTNDDARVARIMLANVIRILFYDKALRSLTLYNAWRLQIATGHTATLVAGMTAGTVIGQAIFPGAGAVLGFSFGVVGGLLTLAVPEPVNTAVTDRIARARAWSNEVRAQTAEKSITQVTREYARPGLVAWTGDQRKQIYLSRWTEQLNVLKNARESEVTARVEILFRTMARLKVLDGQIQTSADAGNTEARDQLKIERGALEASRLEQLNQLSEIYPRELARLGRLRAPADESFARLLLNDQLRAGELALKFKLLRDAPADSKDAETLITKMYLLGFAE